MSCRVETWLLGLHMDLFGCCCSKFYHRYHMRRLLAICLEYWHNWSLQHFFRRSLCPWFCYLPKYLVQYWWGPKSRHHLHYQLKRNPYRLQTNWSIWLSTNDPCISNEMDSLLCRNCRQTRPDFLVQQQISAHHYWTGFLCKPWPECSWMAGVFWREHSLI